jgi:hypothetical protein
MKKLFLAAAIMAFLLCAAAAAFAVEDLTQATLPPSPGQVVLSNVGTLDFEGTFKAGFNYYAGNQTLGTSTSNGVTSLAAEQRPQDLEFQVNYLMLRFYGWVIDKRVTYDVSFNMYVKSLPLTYDKVSSVTVTQVTKGGKTTYPAVVNYKTGNIEGNQPVFQLSDFKLGFHYIPYVDIYVGRILPAFTYENSIPSANFKFVEDPMMNQNIVRRDRETGLDFNLVTPYIDANLGVYNGRAYYPNVVVQNGQTIKNTFGFLPPNANQNPDGSVGNEAIAWGDENTGKDFHLGVIVKPPLAGMKIRGNIWYGMPLDGYQQKYDGFGAKVEEDAHVTFLNGGLDYLAPYGFTFIADVLYGSYVWNAKDPSYGTNPSATAKNFSVDRTLTVNGKLVKGAAAYTVDTLTYYITAGYNFGPVLGVPIELIARYDWWDPDTLNDNNKHPLSQNDQLTDITGGINYYIKGYNAMLRLDYIHHIQAWKNVENIDGTGVQTGIHDDAVKLEAQIAF